MRRHPQHSLDWEIEEEEEPELYGIPKRRRVAIKTEEQQSHATSYTVKKTEPLVPEQQRQPQKMIFLETPVGKKRGRTASSAESSSDVLWSPVKPDESALSQESVTSGQTSEIEAEYVETCAELRRVGDNALATSLLAMNLYLEPTQVLYICIYWMVGYANFRQPEREWFGDCLTALVTEPLRLQISSSAMISNVHSLITKHVLLLQFTGTPLHRIPSEYFVAKENAALLECLDYLIRPENECFLSVDTHGLQGEIELGVFKYNRILSYFYEPSFYVITMYYLFIQHLLTMRCGGGGVTTTATATKGVSQSLRTELSQPLETNDLLQIVQESVHTLTGLEQSLSSLDSRNSNYHYKSDVFSSDMHSLRSVLTAATNLADLDRAITSLWSTKASFVMHISRERFAVIYEQISKYK